MRARETPKAHRKPKKTTIGRNTYENLEEQKYIKIELGHAGNRDMCRYKKKMQIPVDREKVNPTTTKTQEGG